MSNVPIPIPDLPMSIPEDQVKFMRSIKELLETFNGERDPNFSVVLGSGTANVDVGAVKTKMDLPFLDTKSIRPPTNFVVTIREWSHLLTWVNTTDSHLDGVEVWCHTSDSVTEATRLAIVGRKTSSYERFGFDPTVDYYYWIRSLSYTGKYSTWVPTTLQGGLLVPRRESLRERIEGVMKALKGDDPGPYVAGTIYEIDDPVSYIGIDGNKRRYRRRNYDIGVAGKDPTLTLYWERTGILMEGEIDGVNTVGIDGQLVVDGSILARAIQTDTLIVGDGSNGTIKIQDGTITVAALAPALAADALNENVMWEEITGADKPESGATHNRVFVQSSAPASPINGALWIDTSRNPYRHKIYYNGVWRTAATDNTNWEHPTNVTKIDGGTIYTGTIVAASIAANAITANHIGTNTIITNVANIANAVISTAKIANAAITEAKIGSAAVTNAKIANAAITTAKIGLAEIDTLRVQGNAITAPTYANTQGNIDIAGSYTTLQTITVNSGGAFTQLSFSVVFNNNNTEGTIYPPNLDFRVYMDSTDNILVASRHVIRYSSDAGLFLSGLIPLTPATGNHTYYMQAKKADAFTYGATKRTLTALVMKR